MSGAQYLNLAERLAAYAGIVQARARAEHEARGDDSEAAVSLPDDVMLTNLANEGFGEYRQE